MGQPSRGRRLALVATFAAAAARGPFTMRDKNQRGENPRAEHARELTEQELEDRWWAEEQRREAGYAAFAEAAREMNAWFCGRPEHADLWICEVFRDPDRTHEPPSPNPAAAQISWMHTAHCGPPGTERTPPCHLFPPPAGRELRL